MMSRNYFARLILGAALAIMASCAGFAPKPETFNERMAAGLATVTLVRETTTSLLAADTITVDDAQNVQDQANNARAALDLAERLKAIDFTAADAKLETTRLILRGLRNYLVCRESVGQNCIIEASP